MAVMQALHEQLLTLKHVGSDGFEGLIANLLSNLTGKTYRLARSGRQHGRDGSTAPDKFDIFFEAKHYKEKFPSTEELQSKFLSAYNTHKTCLDVWVLAGSAACGDSTVAELYKLTEQCGVTLIVLDWSENPLPRLAVLLAAHTELVYRWFADNNINSSNIKAELDVLSKSENFDNILAEIKANLTSATAGLAYAREQNHKWFKAVFSERQLARRKFGQFLSPLDKSSPSISRNDLNIEFINALRTQKNGLTLISVLGEEGTGKTWIPLTAWLSLPEDEKPFLLLCTSNFIATDAELRNPLKILAELMADQTGSGSSEESIQKWQRRIENWSQRQTDSNYRFLIILDGLNERESKNWITTIDSFSSIGEKLGIQIALTSRPLFWKNNILPRLSGYQITEVPSRDYNDDELEQGLSFFNLQLKDIQVSVREFIRNPRVFSVAISLLDKLQPNELTRERLLFEYWKKRLEERGNGLYHSDFEMKELLISHGKIAREKIANSHGAILPSYRRAEWKLHSGLINRRSDPSIDDELTEVEEGRFFAPQDDKDGYYILRVDGLPYALALLIVDELKATVTSGTDPFSSLDEALNPLRGFDSLSDILLAVVGVACLDKSNEQISAAAICQTLYLQNLPDVALEVLSAYVSSAPNAFHLAAEFIWKESRHNSIQQNWIYHILLNKRSHPLVAPIMKQSIRKWLGVWTQDVFRPLPTSTQDINYEKQLEYQEVKKQEIATNISKLTDAEKLLLEKNCIEESEHSISDINHLAIILLAGMPLSDFSEVLLSREIIAATVRIDNYPRENATWLLRLNKVDPEATGIQIEYHLKELENKSISEMGLRAAYNLYWRTGLTVYAEELKRIESLLPVQDAYPGWSLAEEFCDTDPLDFNSNFPSNIAKAVDKINSLDVSKMVCFDSHTSDDQMLQVLTCGLSRFQPQPLEIKINELVQDLKKRTGESFRLLAMELYKYSPLFSKVEIEILKSILQSNLENNNSVGLSNPTVALQYLLVSLLPHMQGCEQLDLLLELPENETLLLLLRPHFKGVSPEVLELYFEYHDRYYPQNLDKLLFFTSSGLTDITDKVLVHIKKAYLSENNLIRYLAFEVASTTRDPDLLSTLWLSDWSALTAPKDLERYYGSQILALGLEKIDNIEDFSRISVYWQMKTFNRLDEKLKNLFIQNLENCLNSNANLAANDSPAEQIIREISESHFSFAYYSYDIEKFASKTFSRSIEFESPDKRTEYYKAKSDHFQLVITNLQNSLRENAVELLAEPIELEEYMDILAADNTLNSRLISYIEQANDQKLTKIMQIALLATVVLSESEPEQAKKIFNRLLKINPEISFVKSSAKLPFQKLTLWQAADTPPLKELRKSVLLNTFQDKELQIQVLCAEYIGKSHMLWELIEEFSKSSKPHELALALTLAAFSNDKQSIELFADNRFDQGFLNQVKTYAKKVYELNVWAKHWHEKAIESKDYSEYWQNTQLMIKASDYRFVLWLKKTSINETTPFNLYAPFLLTQLKRSANKKSSKRETTLFGYRKPSSELIEALVQGASHVT